MKWTACLLAGIGAAVMVDVVFVISGLADIVDNNIGLIVAMIAAVYFEFVFCRRAFS